MWRRAGSLMRLAGVAPPNHCFPAKPLLRLLLQRRLTYFSCKAALPAALRDPRPQHAFARA